MAAAVVAAAILVAVCHTALIVFFVCYCCRLFPLWIRAIKMLHHPMWWGAHKWKVLKFVMQWRSIRTRNNIISERMDAIFAVFPLDFIGKRLNGSRRNICSSIFTLWAIFAFYGQMTVKFFNETHFLLCDCNFVWATISKCTRAGCFFFYSNVIIFAGCAWYLVCFTRSFI